MIRNCRLKAIWRPQNFSRIDSKLGDNRFMSELTWRDKLMQSSQSAVYVLEPKKAAKFKATTMLVASPLDIQSEIAKIENCVTRELYSLGKALAAKYGADITCPRSMSMGWKLVALTSEESRSNGEDNIVPWWRVIRVGKPIKHSPNGAEYQRALLFEEGFEFPPSRNRRK